MRSQMFRTSAVFIFLIAVLAAGAAHIVAQTPPAAPPSNTPIHYTPVADLNEIRRLATQHPSSQFSPPPQMTVRPRSTPTLVPRRPGETRDQFRSRILRERGGIVRNVADETRGKLITINGRPVQLPADAYVHSIVMNISCLPDAPCPEVPAYRIVRGGSALSVSVRTGQIFDEAIAPGHSEAFTFLKEALR